MDDHHTTDTRSHGSHTKKAFIDTLPVLAAYFPLGIVWGVLWEQAGFSPLWGIAYSVCIYAGAVQFLALSLLVTGAPIWLILATVVPVALRNSFYTVTVIDRLPTQPWLRGLLAFMMVDAPFAIFLTKDRALTNSLWYTMPLFGLVHLYWVGGTAIGVYAGGSIPNGIDSLEFALPALLAVLAMQQVQKLKSSRPLAIAITSAAIAWIVFGHAWLMPAMAACAAATVLLSNQKAPLS